MTAFNVLTWKNTKTKYNLYFKNKIKLDNSGAKL